MLTWFRKNIQVKEMILGDPALEKNSTAFRAIVLYFHPFRVISLVGSFLRAGAKEGTFGISKL